MAHRGSKGYMSRIDQWGTGGILKPQVAPEAVEGKLEVEVGWEEQVLG